MVSDEVLLSRLRAGELAAFDALYARYEAPLLGFLRQLLRDGAEAEDALQEAFVAVVRERDSEVRCFKAWLYQVARHGAQNRIRSRSRGVRAIGAAALDPTMAEPPPAPDRALDREERGAALARGIASLPTGLADVYRLRAGGASYDEIADALGVPVGTVKSRMNELVNRLRSEVKA